MSGKKIGLANGLIEATKRGALAAGGPPITFPIISLGESFVSPTTHLICMDVEEMVRARPMDAVVPIGGCDFDFLQGCCRKRGSLSLRNTLQALLLASNDVPSA